jgi:hypothetical protein
MNEIEAIDLMLRHCAENNLDGRGYLSPEKIFDQTGVPREMRGYLLREVIDLGLFEYNNPTETGIRATLYGRKVYQTGGYKKQKERETANELLREKAEKAERRKSIFDYRQRWFTHPLTVGIVCAILGYILGRLW